MTTDLAPWTMKYKPSERPLLMHCGVDDDRRVRDRAG